MLIIYVNQTISLSISRLWGPFSLALFQTMPSSLQEYCYTLHQMTFTQIDSGEIGPVRSAQMLTTIITNAVLVYIR